MLCVRKFLWYSYVFDDDPALVETPDLQIVGQTLGVEVLGSNSAILVGQRVDLPVVGEERGTPKVARLSQDGSHIFRLAVGTRVRVPVFEGVLAEGAVDVRHLVVLRQNL